jgi:hypothetical protein
LRRSGSCRNGAEWEQVGNNLQFTKNVSSKLSSEGNHLVETTVP